MLHFDSYEYVKRFEQVGITQEQAVVIIKLMQENREEELKNYVTKDQLGAIEKDINSMKTDIALMKQDIIGIKTEIIGIKAEMVTKNELRADLKEQKSEILAWMFGMFLTMMSILSAIAFKIFIE